MSANSIPNVAQPIAGTARVDPTWFRFFSELERRSRASGIDVSAEIAALARKLGSPDGTIAGIPAETGGQLVGLSPVIVGGQNIGLESIAQPLVGELFGIQFDEFGRVTGARPVVAGSGVTIDGTTNPDQIELRASGLTNPMTTAGDIITGGVAGAPQRLGVGTDGQVLKVVSGAPSWAAESGSAPAIAWEGYATVNPDTATSSAWGITAPTATGGGVSAKFMTAASKLAALPRRSHNATASTTALGGVRGSNGLVFFMATSTCGGCEVEMIASPGLGATVASHRFFGGWLSNNNAPTDVNPSTLTNIVGVGYDSGDTNLQFMHNDGSGAATKVDLGSGLPKPTVAEAAAYLIRITSNVAGQVSYFVENIITGNTATGSVSTNLPTVGLNWQSWQSAGGTSTAIEHLWSYSRVKVFA